MRATVLRCAFIDADQTGNLAKWAMRAAEHGYWSDAIDAYQTIDAAEVAEIADEIAAEGNIDLLIIDTAGDASRDHDVFAIAADLILCPILLSHSDLETARGTANYVYRMKDRAEDPSQMPTFRILLNRVATRPSKGDRDLIAAIRSTPLVGPDEETPLEVLQILGAVLQEREAYKAMDRDGLLGQILARHAETAPTFAKNPKHLINALIEAEHLLAACFAVVECTHGPK